MQPFKCLPYLPCEDISKAAPIKSTTSYVFPDCYNRKCKRRTKKTYIKCPSKPCVTSTSAKTMDSAEKPVEDQMAHSPAVSPILYSRCSTGNRCIAIPNQLKLSVPKHCLRKYYCGQGLRTQSVISPSRSCTSHRCPLPVLVMVDTGCTSQEQVITFDPCSYHGQAYQQIPCPGCSDCSPKRIATTKMSSHCKKAQSKSSSREEGCRKASNHICNKKAEGAAVPQPPSRQCKGANARYETEGRPEKPPKCYDGVEYKKPSAEKWAAQVRCKDRQ